MEEGIMSRLLKKNPVKAPDTYMRLIRRFPLRPIRTSKDYDAAAAVLDTLAVRDESDLDAGERDYLSVLCDLVEAYDDQHHVVESDKRPARQKLAALIAEHNVSTLELARVLGVGRSLASLILTGKRRITADHAKALGARFKLQPGYFL
jgi:HTH-type transcriptional regulator/antitoxin HigA